VEQPGEPIGTAVDVLGDRWTLLILRDVIFEDRRYFRALLTGSAEGIASNMLADRLVRLVEAGILARGTAARGQRARYSLTEAGIQTLPILRALAEWSGDWRDGGDLPDIDEDDLRARHLNP
jgi:DNA-binding HxlR family transcriptional regulator